MGPFSQYYQRVKNVIHAVQALAIFVAWAITIAILTKRGRTDGRLRYYFALVSNLEGAVLPRRKANSSAVLVLHTCSHLPDRFPRLPKDTALFQCLRPRGYRYRLHHILARRLCLPDRLGQTRFSCGQRLEEHGQFV